MANYGPPGGASPDPWHGRRSSEGYDTVGRGPGWGEPEDARPPWDQGAYPTPRQPEERTGYRPAGPGSRYDEGVRYGPGQDDVPGYAAGPRTEYGSDAYRAPESGPVPYGGDPLPPPPRRGRGRLVAVLAVVAVLVLGGGAAAYLLLGGDDPAPLAAPTEPAASGGTDADLTNPTAVPSAPAPESSADPRFVKVGQCVRNEGLVGGKPKLLISSCAPKSYEVLRRFDGTTSGERDAETKCAKVEGYTNWYFFDSELDTLDFVLCLKQR